LAKQNEDPQGADLAWVTRREEWAQSDQVKDYGEEFAFWANTDEGKREIQELRKKVESLKQMNLQIV